VDFTVQPGETFGLVGESGCGKSTLGKTILGIYQPTAGAVRFQGQVISGVSKAAARQVRRALQYVYQDPGASLDPWWTVGRSLQEPLRIHTKLSRQEIAARVEEMIIAVGLAPHHLQRYPHEFSGGQQRRLALARILVLKPRLIIFDEPTAGLDVSVQATMTVVALLLALSQGGKGAFYCLASSRSMASTSGFDSGATLDLKRATRFPSRASRNFSKFH